MHHVPWIHLHAQSSWFDYVWFVIELHLKKNVVIFDLILHDTSSFNQCSIQFCTVLQSFSILFSYVRSTQMCSICFGFSQVFKADLPHHAPLGHRCLRLHRPCHHRGGRPCHHRYDLTRRTQRWCSRRLVLIRKRHVFFQCVFFGEFVFLLKTVSL